MTAPHISEEEYRRRIKPNIPPEKRNDQKVTTYYKENEREKEGLRHHEQRREQNRLIRERERGPEPTSSKVGNFLKGFGASAGRTIKTQAVAWGNRINDTHERNEGSRGRRRRGERVELPHINEDTGRMFNPFGGGGGIPVQDPFGGTHYPGEVRQKRGKKGGSETTVRIVHEFPKGMRNPPVRGTKKGTRRRSEKSYTGVGHFDPMHIPKSLKRFF